MNEDARNQGSVTGKALGIGGGIALGAVGILGTGWGISKIGKGVGGMGKSAISGIKKGVQKAGNKIIPSKTVGDVVTSESGKMRSAEEIARKKLMKKHSSPIGPKPFVGPKPLYGPPEASSQYAQYSSPIGPKPFVGPQKPFVGPQPFVGPPRPSNSQNHRFANPDYNPNANVGDIAIDSSGRTRNTKPSTILL